MESKKIIGIMGPGEGATPADLELAYEIGKWSAEKEFTTLTGGRNSGVMEAASKGAKEAGGLTVGILPLDDKSNMSQYVDIPVVTGMGNARNSINVLSSDVVVAVGTGLGTTSEIMLALKSGKPVIAVNYPDLARDFYTSFQSNLLFLCKNIEEVKLKLESLSQ